jgi:ubiquinone/menaquinone biosynthesis C-methylase UbiE
MVASRDAVKSSVQAFWNEASCGEVYAEGNDFDIQFESQRATRYVLEPFIPAFAGFDAVKGARVLEIGVGMGADHLEFALGSPLLLCGLDFSSRAVEWTQRRLALGGIQPNLLVADAEHLPLASNTFDLVYSWGVLHHTPDTGAAFDEAWRVLRPGGVLRVMVYGSRSIAALLLWLRYALAVGRPWRTPRSVAREQLESPGTKTLTRREVQGLLTKFSSVRIERQLSAADLLEGAAGQRHSDSVLGMARRVWPRRLIRQFAQGFGLFVMIEATK